MNIALTALAVFLLTVVLFLAGCTCNKPFRTSFPPYGPGADQTKAVIESTDSYKLGFVEFDEQGWPWIARQRTVVEEMIRSEAGLPADPASAAVPHSVSQGIILVAFVHGWKDNAEYENDGVTAFRTILTELNKAEQSQKDHLPRKVVGVYAAWRGLSATWEPFKELSIWERMDTAHRVGGYGAMTSLLVDLENIQKESLDSLTPDAPRTELIIIGHSLGAGVVYSALSQIITERFVNTIGNTKDQKRLKPLGDQVIFLNPAFEAVRYYDLIQMAKTIGSYPADQRPVVSIFTSEGDWATGYVFPIVRFFSTIFENNRDDQQRSANLKTAGWYKPFITHRLAYNENATVPPGQTSTYDVKAGKHEYHNREDMARSIDNVKTQRAKWHPNGGVPQTYYFDDTVLNPKDDFRPGDPFLVVSVDTRIMKDHTDIAKPVFVNFIREYIEFCQVDPKDRSK